MSLRKVGNYYWLDIRIKGKRIRRSLHTDNKFLALDRYKEKKDELSAEYNGSKVRFSGFCEQYLEWAWSSKPASTLREKQRLEKIKEFFEGIGIQFLEDITPYHIEQLTAYLKIDVPGPGGKKGVSKTTVNYYLQILRGLFNKAIAWEVYNKPNPLKKVRFFKISRNMNLLTGDEIQRIIAAAELISQDPGSPIQKVFPDIIRFTVNTGLRKSEVFKLKWTDVRADEIVVKGKGDKYRIVPLNQAAKKIIEQQPQKDRFVFEIPNRHQKDAPRRTVARIQKMTGINWHFHLLRHYFASALVEKGIDFVTAQRSWAIQRLWLA